MIAGVQDMIVALARHFRCARSRPGTPRGSSGSRAYGVREHFVEVIGAQTTRRMSPHPEPLRFAAAAMGVEPQVPDDREIHDRHPDGLAAGAQTVGVLCGFGTEAELRRLARNSLRTTSDLLAVLRPRTIRSGRRPAWAHLERVQWSLSPASNCNRVLEPPAGTARATIHFVHRMWLDSRIGPFRQRRVTASIESPRGNAMHLEMDEPARPFVIGAWLIAVFLLWFVRMSICCRHCSRDCWSSSWSIS
jgi:hypothetical protein